MSRINSAFHFLFASRETFLIAGGLNTDATPNAVLDDVWYYDPFDYVWRPWPNKMAAKGLSTVVHSRQSGKVFHYRMGNGGLPDRLRSLSLGSDATLAEKEDDRQREGEQRG